MNIIDKIPMLITVTSMIETNKLCSEIIGSAFSVYNQLGFGYLESVYQKSLEIELTEKEIPHLSQHRLKVSYKAQVVGDFIPDLLIENQLIIELKSIQCLNSQHETQLVNYLTATGINDGLLINFGPKTVEIKHKYKRYQKAANNPVNPV